MVTRCPYVCKKRALPALVTASWAPDNHSVALLLHLLIKVFHRHLTMLSIALFHFVKVGFIFSYVSAG